MVDLVKLRDYMRTQAEEDRKTKWVQVVGSDIEDALHQAAIELGIPVKKIEYEVRDPGSKGTFGFGKRECILVAYQAREETGKEELSAEDELSLGALLGNSAAESADKDGEVFVRLTPDGVLLKVSAPVGKGKKAAEKLALQKLNERSVSRFNNSLVSKIVKAADSQYVRIGDIIYNPINDSILTIDISDSDMKAFIIARPPGPGGTDITSDSIRGFLSNNGVIHGINEELVDKFEDYPVYDESILIAEGTKAENGKDARIVYNFEIDHSQVKLKEKNGKVDFKEMNLVQNVVEGQALARKVPFSQGQPGRTVKGKMLPAKDGKDIPFGVGKNVKLSQDGMTAIAGINGQVIVSNDKINVEPIYVVPGDVNLKTGGNVIFLGTVLIKGSVDDGFKVKAAGNIEVLGNVGKAELDAEGDIIVHQGIAGKGGGIVKAGKGVWAKFIENGTVESGEIVVASDGIINSHVEANKRIICQGKRATIVGGHLRSSEEIHAKTLGSVSGSETVLEVGWDPKSKAKLAEFEGQLNKLEKDLEEIQLNIKTLENIKKVKKELPEEKENYLQELIKKNQEMLNARKHVLNDIEEVQAYLASLKIMGKVSASGRVFSGVRIVIKDASLEVKNEFRSVTFINETNLVKITKYEKLEEDYTRK